MFRTHNDEKLYQWDLNRSLIVEDETIKEVHFANCLCNEARVVEVKDIFGVRGATIPNELLQEYLDIKAWAVDGYETKYCATFPVEKRTKPADYVYTETEVKRYEDLEGRILVLETNTNSGIVRYDRTQSLTATEKQRARNNLGVADRYAYNFQNLYNELTFAPADAFALNYIVENWNKVPMSIYIQGYPVIGIDLNDRYLRVLKDDRYLYSFRWKVENSSYVILTAHSVLKLTNENEIINTVKDGNKETKTFKPELLPAHTHSITDLSENVADYVIEEGKSGTWTIRKWASGKAECWKNVIVQKLSNSAFVDSKLITFNGLDVGFGIYWTKDIPINFDYPFVFEELPVETATLATSDGSQPYNLIAVGGADTAKTNQYRIVTFKQPAVNTVDVKISLYAVGTLKSEEAAE